VTDTEKPGSDKHPDLLSILVQNKIISQAQAQLVKTDIEVTGMLTEDILLARRWVKPEMLFELAPWLGQQEGERAGGNDNEPREYKENLKRYRQFTNEILGEQREE
jgi:hypothetical protein